MTVMCITPVKCGKCKGWHATAQRVRECYFPPQSKVPPATVEQGRALRVNKESKMSDHWTSAPNRVATKIPMMFLEDLRDGYYAARQQDDHAYTFFRVSRPKRGLYKGCLKIQTQHGPDYQLVMVVRPDQSVTVFNFAVEDELMIVCLDQPNCAFAYAEKMEACMRCNTELTDERSRYYGIGPECEKHWPHMIELVDLKKGPYVPGADL